MLPSQQQMLPAGEQKMPLTLPQQIIMPSEQKIVPAGEQKMPLTLPQLIMPPTQQQGKKFIYKIFKFQINQFLRLILILSSISFLQQRI